MEIGVDEKTIYRTVKGQTLLSYPKMETFYEFLFRNRIQINAIKEMSYRENMPSANKLLFHGSKAGIEGDVDISKSRANSDFGHGFYTGESLSQSLAFVKAYESSSVYLFEFDPMGLSHKRFGVDDEWMLAIAYFRGRLSSYSSSPVIRKIVSDVDSADYLIAPIADNSMFQIIDSFIAGELTDEQCRHCLSATNLGNQYVMKSDRATNHLITNIMIQSKGVIISGISAQSRALFSLSIVLPVGFSGANRPYFGKIPTRDNQMPACF